MPVFGTFHRRRGGSLPCLQKGGPTPPSPNLQYSDAGSRWAYRGRPAHPYAQSARDTPRQHSLGSRDRCPVCAPGAAYAPTSYLVLLAPRKDGAAAGGIPLPGATGQFCAGREIPWHAPRHVCRPENRTRATRPGETGSTCDRSERRCTPAGVESGGNAEASYA